MKNRKEGEDLRAEIVADSNSKNERKTQRQKRGSLEKGGGGKNSRCRKAWNESKSLVPEEVKTEGGGNDRLLREKLQSVTEEMRRGPKACTRPGGHEKGGGRGGGRNQHNNGGGMRERPKTTFEKGVEYRTERVQSFLLRPDRMKKGT